MTPPARSAQTPGWSRAQRWAAAGLATLGAVALALLYFHRPEGQFFYPRCTFHQATGLLCPGCGSLRASHALLHGRWLEALRCNLLLVAGLPVLILGWLAARRCRKTPALNARAIWIVFAVSTVFTLVRNLPIPAARWLCP